MILKGFQLIKQVFKKDDPEEAAVNNSLQLDSKEDNPEVLDVGESMHYGFSVEEQLNGVKERVLAYRSMLNHHEIDEAVQEIVNEAVVLTENEPVQIVLDDLDVSERIKDKIIAEFEELMEILEFGQNGDEIFKKWYVDGRLYLQKVIDLKAPKKGIQDIKVLSPLTLIKVREKSTGKKFYIYTPDVNREKLKSKEGLQIPEEHIVFAPSGLLDTTGRFHISHLSRAMKPLNLVRMVEDSAIIYRITRAPERRVYYVDVGKMPKTKAEGYMKGLMSRFKNRMVYDSATGTLSQQKDIMTMTEDIWLPTSSDGNGTKVDVLQGGQQLGEITDIEYFKKKLLKSVKVPYSRFDAETQPSMVFGNMNGEVSREEVRFSKFVDRCRSKFAIIFFDLLKTQLILKGIIDINDWPEIKQGITFRWARDQYYERVSRQERLSGQINLLNEIDPYIGKYFSEEYVFKDVLDMDDEDIKRMKEQIAKEREANAELEGEDGEGDEENDDF